MRNIISLTLGLLFLSACTWVELAPDAEDVRIVEAVHVANCKMVGTTTVSVTPDVASFKRNPEKIKSDLEILARNEAIRLKGDTLVAVTDIQEGEQTFKVYKCKP
ncbi:MAG: DUF4156 domain-containing protein [Gammaproteobacteria bacterium]